MTTTEKTLLALALTGLLMFGYPASGMAADPPEGGMVAEPPDPNAEPYPPDGVTDPDIAYPTDDTGGTDEGEAGAPGPDHRGAAPEAAD